MLTAQDVLQSCGLVQRIIEDMILIFIGSLQSAEDVKKCLVEKFEKESLKLTFRHIHSRSVEKEVEILYVIHVIDSDDPVRFITRDFVKPTTV